MVAKINYGSSLYGALAYNGEKVNDGVARILETNKVFCSADNRHDITACMQDFLAYMPSQVHTKKPVIHISLNPHPDDKLSDEQFSAIALEYIEKMGYGNQPFVVYKHEDIDRHHLHIVTLAVDEQGKKINDGNNFYTSTRILKELERRLYGITFIDQNNGCVVNGSRLGKELSANAVAEWFDRPHPELSAPIQQSEKGSIPKTQTSDGDSVLGGLLDLPLETHGTDWEEEQFRRRMQRKKRKQRKL